MSKLHRVEVKEIRSGDDLLCLVGLGIDDLYKRVRIRLHEVDAPNCDVSSPTVEALAVRDEVANWLKWGEPFIEIVKEGKGSWVCVLYVVDTRTQKPVCINQMLKEKGYVYGGPKFAAKGAAT